MNQHMKQLLLAYALSSLIVSGALGCGVSAFSDPTETATPDATSISMTATVAPTETATAPPTPAPLAPKPADVSAYASAIAAFLNETSNSVVSCGPVESLLISWGMRWDDASPPCIQGNTDGDEADELVVRDCVQDAQAACYVTVLDSGGGILGISFRSTPIPFDPWLNMGNWPRLFAAEDINEDGNGELVCLSELCGAHTCFVTVHVLSGRPSGYLDIAPGIEMAYPTIGLEDENGDGLREFVLHGGIIGSVGAGPQRARTEIYSWDRGRPHPTRRRLSIRRRACTFTSRMPTPPSRPETSTKPCPSTGRRWTIRTWGLRLGKGSRKAGTRGTNFPPGPSSNQA